MRLFWILNTWLAERSAHPDKWLHAIVGFLIVLAVGVLASPGWALIACALAAVGKEAYDALNPARHTADPLDVVATMAGGAAGLLAAFAARWALGWTIYPLPLPV